MDTELSDAGRTVALLERNSVGCLSTLSAEGFPFGSMMPYALGDDGSPVFLASNLAEHTINFKQDPRASLMVTDPMKDAGDPLSFERVTLVGVVERIDGEGPQNEYLTRHPYARAYAGFDDFDFYKLIVERIRYVGGFGKMSWMKAEELNFAR